MKHVFPLGLATVAALVLHSNRINQKKVQCSTADKNQSEKTRLNKRAPATGAQASFTDKLRHRLARQMALVFLFLLFSVPSLFASSPSAIYVYDSFGPGNTYNSGNKWIVGGSSTLHGYQAHAEYFVPTISGYLSTVQLATALISGVPNSNLFIAVDNGSGIPGTILESYNDVVNANGLLTISSTIRPLLEAGQKYWLCDEPSDPTTYIGWYMNNQGVSNDYAFQTQTTSGSWFPATAFGANGVFSVSVDPVPEPDALALAGLGSFGGLAALFRRRK